MNRIKIFGLIFTLAMGSHSAVPASETGTLATVSAQCFGNFLGCVPAGSENGQSFYPIAGFGCKLEADWPLPQGLLLGTMAEMQADSFDYFDMDAGIGVGYALYKAGRYRLDILGMPFFGVSQSDFAYTDPYSFLWGFRLEGINRLTLIGRLSALAAIGIEWRGNHLDLPIGLGFSF